MKTGSANLGNAKRPARTEHPLLLKEEGLGAAGGIPARRGYEVSKRVFDILLAALGIAILLPVLPWIALAITLNSPGPLFYTQARIGRCGQIFRIIKFRSMQVGAEELGPQWAAHADRRVTGVGRLLRRFHLDELPQLLNILRGEMSFVGPRPEIPSIVAQLSQELPGFSQRHAVRPGAAGWALVRQGYADSHAAAREKLEHDLFYIRNRSMRFDLQILIRSAGLMIRGAGR